jgi:hypothetical protein
MVPPQEKRHELEKQADIKREYDALGSPSWRCHRGCGRRTMRRR